MKFLSIIAAFSPLILLVSSSEQNCSKPDSANPTCQKNRDAHDIILSWWKTLSEQKPVKCRDTRYRRPLAEDIEPHKTVVQYADVCTAASFKVNVRHTGFKTPFANNSIQGSGKAKVLVKHMHGDETVVETCYKWFNYQNRQVMEYVGTIVDGTLQGQAKLLLNDDHTIVGRFNKGVPHGLIREFDPQGKLKMVQYQENGRISGYFWELIKGNVLKFNFRGDGEKVLEPVTSLFIDVNKTEFWTGQSEHHIGILVNLSDYEVTSVKLPDPDVECMLTDLKGEVKDKKDFNYDIEMQTKMPIVPVEADYCKQDYLTPYQRLYSISQSKTFYKFRARSLYHMKAFNRPLDTANAKYLISNLKLTDESLHLFSGSLLGKHFDTLYSPDMSLDSNGQLHGINILQLNNQMAGVNLPPTNHSLIYGIQGRFIHGQLTGVTILYVEGGRGMYVQVQNGIMHGHAIGIGQRPILPSRTDIGNTTRSNRPDMSFLGHFENGYMTGHYLVGLLGGGFFQGYQNIGDPEELTADNLTYIYPDMQTALQGRFDQGFMKAAKEVEVLETGCDEWGMPIATKFTKPKEEGTVFFYEPATNESFAGGPKGVMDPFEVRWVELANSSLDHGGEGVILKKKPLGPMPVSLYTGFLYEQQEQSNIFQQRYCYNKSISDEQARHCKKYSLSINYNNVLIDIPWEYDQPGVFHPSLGPKVNHHFTKHNSEYIQHEHPRWGLSQSVQIKESHADKMNAGDELFTYYYYNEGSKFPNDFPWYFELKKKLIKSGELKPDGSQWGPGEKTNSVPVKKSKKKHSKGKKKKNKNA